MELYLHSPSMPSWRGAQLKKITGTTLCLPFYLFFFFFVVVKVVTYKVGVYVLNK
jgi:hypothetical protein